MPFIDGKAEGWRGKETCPEARTPLGVTLHTSWEGLSMVLDLGSGGDRCLTTEHFSDGSSD